MIVAPHRQGERSPAVAPVLFIVPLESATVTGSVPMAVDSTRPKLNDVLEGTRIDVLAAGAISSSLGWYSNW